MTVLLCQLSDTLLRTGVYLLYVESYKRVNFHAYYINRYPLVPGMRRLVCVDCFALVNIGLPSLAYTP